MPAEGYTKRRHKWTEEDVIKKVKEWVDEHGEIPSAADWSTDTLRASRHHAGLAQHWMNRYLRFKAGEWPWTGTIYKLFGGWNAMIKAAGYEPRAAVRPGYEKKPIGDLANAIDEIAVMVSLAKSADDVSEQKEQMYAVAERALAIAEALSDES